jgi:tetratricopeptide (TPR) repeat protein
MEMHLLHRETITLLAALLIGFAQSAYAATTDDWNTGQDAFQQGDYVSALRSFQSAKRSGQGGPAIHYNIAVCHFKLNDFDQARLGFRYVGEQFPAMLGLAEYNLGLVARRLGESESARQHFLHAYELSPDDETLRALSSRRLRELEPTASLTSRWTGAIGLRAGNDDNVALRDDIGLPAGSTAESPMLDVFGSIRGPWTGANGFRVDGSAYLIQYFDAGEFDQTDIRGRVFYEWSLNDWRFEFGAHASASTLGGDAFDQKAGASGQAVWYLGRKTSVDLRYAYEDISNADPVFAGIRGSRQLFDARYRWYSGGHRLILNYRTETNDRDDPSVSPSRIRLSIDYRYQPDQGWGYEAGVYIRNSDYEDLAPPREEELTSVRAGLTHMLPAKWLVMLDFRYSENDSSDQKFSYDRTQVTLGVMKMF